MTVKIEIEGLDEIRRKFAAFPTKFEAVMRDKLGTALMILDENKPPYPPKPPNSTYIRTHTLERTLGSSQAPGLRAVKMGSKLSSAEWGTNLEYAPYVIGEKEQAEVHKGRWWTIKTIADRSIQKIQTLFVQMTEDLAKWLDAQ